MGFPKTYKKSFENLVQCNIIHEDGEFTEEPYYVEGYEAADIPDMEFISINTVKKHNRSIYQKLEVASRDELMLFIELFRCCGRLGELTSEREAI